MKPSFEFVVPDSVIQAAGRSTELFPLTSSTNETSEAAGATKLLKHVTVSVSELDWCIFANVRMSLGSKV